MLKAKPSDERWLETNRKFHLTLILWANMADLLLPWRQSMTSSSSTRRIHSRKYLWKSCVVLRFRLEAYWVKFVSTDGIQSKRKIDLCEGFRCDFMRKQSKPFKLNGLFAPFSFRPRGNQRNESQRLGIDLRNAIVLLKSWVRNKILISIYLQQRKCNSMSLSHHVSTDRLKGGATTTVPFVSSAPA